MSRAFFDAIARRYDREYALSGDESRVRMQRVVELLRAKHRVLVLGVGTGRELPSLLDAGHHVTGVDVSSEMIAVCNKRSRTIPIVRADFWEPLPFPDASFDGVVALHGTLAHPPHDEALASLSREIARVLADGGVFVAELPTTAILSQEGPTLTKTGATTFRHQDAASGIAIEGIALSAEGWRAAFGSGLDVDVEPLSAAEIRLVASRPLRRR